MQLPVYKRDGSQSTESVDLPDAMFSGEPNDHAIWLAVRSEEAAQRQGTAHTKTRSFVRGGGRKPFKQKGRGMARQGTSRSPLMPGGSTIFGPQAASLSRDGAGQDQAAGAPQRDDPQAARKPRADRRRFHACHAARPAKWRALFAALGLANEKVLLLTPDFDLTMARSVRNMPRACQQKADAACDPRTDGLLDHRAPAERGLETREGARPCCIRGSYSASRC